MYRVDLQRYTAGYRNDLPQLKGITDPLTKRVRYFGKIRNWLKDKPHTFVYGENSHHFPSHVDIHEEEDALAFTLTFLV